MKTFKKSSLILSYVWTQLAPAKTQDGYRLSLGATEESEQKRLDSISDECCQTANCGFRKKWNLRN